MRLIFLDKPDMAQDGLNPPQLSVLNHVPWKYRSEMVGIGIPNLKKLVGYACQTK